VRQITIITVFFLLFSSIGIGKVTEFDKEFRANPAKGIQDAVILEELGIFDHTFTREMSKKKFHIKMKFFTKKAIEDYGTIKISFDPQGENIGDIKGTVHLPDGKKIKLSKSDIHKKKTSKEWGQKEVEISIVLPGLCEGAIVEYSYYKSFRGIESITKWYFQSDLYTVKSTVTFIPWPGNLFGYSGANQIEVPVIKKGKKERVPFYEITRTNIPPLKKEKFSLPIKSQRESIVFFYFDTDIQYKNYWIDKGNSIYKNSLKKKMKPCKAAIKIVKQNNLIAENSGETLKRVFDYTIKNYTGFLALSKKQLGELTKNYFKKHKKATSVSKMLKLKYLSTTKMNLILASLIKSAIPNATIEYGFYIPFNKDLFNPRVKTFAQFTNEVLKVVISGKTYWLSPGKKLLPPNQLPAGSRGINVLVVGENGTHFDKIPTETYDKAVTYSSKEVFISEDAITIKEKTTYNKHKSFNKRAVMTYFNKNEIKDLFEDDITDNYGEEAELVTFNVENMKNIYKPLIITKEIKYPYELDDSLSKIFLPLFGVNNYTKNPFNTFTRKQNIIFLYPSKTVLKITYHLPEGFRLSSTPKNRKINSKDLIYNITFNKKDDHTLLLTIEDILERNYFKKSAAGYFKNTFNKIIKANDTKIVIEEEEE
jgi:hypothetical protein